MSNLREKMQLEMNLKGFSDRTKQSYISHVKWFSEHNHKSPDKLGTDAIKSYLNYLITEKKVSNSYVNSAYSAIKFLNINVLNSDWELKKIPRAKKEKKLPSVLTEDEVKRLLKVVSNIKHRAILATVYSAGLRVSEVVNLKSTDIDSQSMQIKIRQGKGKKDRYSVLSNKNLEILRNYYRENPWCKHSEWLFPGSNCMAPISARTVQKVFSNAAMKAGIHKAVSVHSLRHSFATHLLERGTSIYHIQRLLGHTNIKTTTVYLHLTRLELMKIQSPLDSMAENHE